MASYKMKEGKPTERAPEVPEVTCAVRSETEQAVEALLGGAGRPVGKTGRHARGEATLVERAESLRSAIEAIEGREL